MAGINKVILVGRLGREPETKYFPSGDAVCNFSIATSESWKDKQSGEKREKTEWHKIVAYRRLAEICGQYLTKGKQVYIEGKLQTRSWEQNGKTKYMTEVVANTMQMLGSGPGANTGSQPAARPQNRPQAGPTDTPFPPGEPEDDIPF